MDTISPGLALREDYSPTEAATGVEWSVRVILILGFAAVLALEAYLIWEGLSLL
jgi:hypothetical protein